MEKQHCLNRGELCSTIEFLGTTNEDGIVWSEYIENFKAGKGDALKPEPIKSDDYSEFKI